jgi:hypothetical protein
LFFQKGKFFELVRLLVVRSSEALELIVLMFPSQYEEDAVSCITILRLSDITGTTFDRLNL